MVTYLAITLRTRTIAPPETTTGPDRDRSPSHNSRIDDQNSMPTTMGR